MIASQPEFPGDLEGALRQGCMVAETEFMKRNLNVIKDKSGSCAVILLVTPTKIYVANVGDSRAIMSE